MHCGDVRGHYGVFGCKSESIYSPETATIYSPELLDGSTHLDFMLGGTVRKIHSESLDTVFPGIQFLEVWKQVTDTGPPRPSVYVGSVYRSWVAYDVESKLVASGGQFGEMEKLFSARDVKLRSRDDVVVLVTALDAFLTPRLIPNLTWKDGPHSQLPDGSWALRLNIDRSPQIVFSIDSDSIVRSVTYEPVTKSRRQIKEPAP
jgi:hypothetical protein